MRNHVRFLRRGRVVEIADLAPRLTLLDWLRLEERSTGTKEGCNEGDCGACTVALGRLKDGRLVYEPVNACILLVGQCDGAEIITVEDLARGETAHPVQDAMVRHHGSQCGFCTPGIVMSLFALYQEGARPVTREAVNDQLSGNLCRCTGYRPIVDAALDACAGPPADHVAARRAGTLAWLKDLADLDDVFVGTEARFFAAPATAASALELLAKHEDATILAGATDVGLWITKQLREIDKIVWLGRVSELTDIVEEDDRVLIGAMVSHAAAEDVLARLAPDFAELMRRFGSKQVRVSGTVGGNIANGSPIGDLAPALIALGATLHLAKGAELRALPLEQFFIAYGKQDRAADELVVAVEVPKLREGQHARFSKVSKRRDEDITAVLACHRLTVSEGVVTAARVAHGGMAATPKRAPKTEAALLGLRLDDPASWEAALDALALDYQPIDDMRASATYRRDVARALLARTLTELARPGVVTRIAGPAPVLLEAAE
jgi:xanthine dehydrogenase small subunit